MQYRARTQAWVRTVQLVVLQITAAPQRNALCAVQQTMRKPLQTLVPWHCAQVYRLAMSM